MIVLIAWLTAVLVAAAVGAVLAFDAVGHLRRLTAAVAAAGQDLAPGVRNLEQLLGGPPTRPAPADPRSVTGGTPEPAGAAVTVTAPAVWQRGRLRARG